MGPLIFWGMSRRWNFHLLYSPLLSFMAQKIFFPTQVTSLYMSKLYMTIKTDDVTCVTMECGSIWAVMGSSLVNRSIKPEKNNIIILIFFCFNFIQWCKFTLSVLKMRLLLIMIYCFSYYQWDKTLGLWSYRRKVEDGDVTENEASPKDTKSTLHRNLLSFI